LCERGCVFWNSDFVKRGFCYVCEVFVLLAGCTPLDVLFDPGSMQGQKYCHCTHLIVSSLPGCPAPQWSCNCLRIFLLRALSGGTTSHPPLSLHSVVCGPSLHVMEIVFSHRFIVPSCFCWAVMVSCSRVPRSPAVKTFRNVSGGRSDISLGSSHSSS